MVENVFQIINKAIKALHGRYSYDMFGLYSQNLKNDIRTLNDRQIITKELKANDFAETLILPNFSKNSPKRLRYMWDCFVFIYMSHKTQNIKRRQSTFNLPTLMYLRGFDYELTLNDGGKAVSNSIMIDTNFQFAVLNNLRGKFNILKTLSPTDLNWAIKDIGPYLFKNGNRLSAVAEFARIRDEGIYLNPKTWKQTFSSLVPSASVFLVYVSNRSNGLKFEIENLLDNKLESNTVLVLDNNRPEEHLTFYKLQDRLVKNEGDLLFSIQKDACNVDDVEGFERLLDRFPHKIEMQRNEQNLNTEIESLIETVIRESNVEQLEIPFDFMIQLNNDERKEIDNFQQLISTSIDDILFKSPKSNWAALLLFIEIKIFLNLIFGNISKAAISIIKYGALADFTTKYLKHENPDIFTKLGSAFEQHGNMAINVAMDALAMGEWNDYSNRVNLSQEMTNRVYLEITALLIKSSTDCKKSIMPIFNNPNFDCDKGHKHNELLKKVIDSYIHVTKSNE